MRNRNAAIRRKEKHLRELARREIQMWTDMSMRSLLELERRDGLGWEDDISAVVQEYAAVWRELAKV